MIQGTFGYSSDMCKRIFPIIWIVAFAITWFVPAHADAATPGLVFTTRPHRQPAAVASWLPKLSPRAWQLYTASLDAGHNAHLFTLAGDSNSNPLRFLDRVTSGAFPLGVYPELRPVVDWFAPSFSHLSLAVGGGFSTTDVIDPANAAGITGCLSGEGLFACELRMSKASVVFILLGTGDRFDWHEFENHYRALLDNAIHQHVLPVLVTKADDLETWQGGASSGYINNVIRRLAQEYQLPLLDLWAATRSLPVVPNPALPKRPFTQDGLQDEWGYYFHLTDAGQDRHILITLQTLALLQPRAGYASPTVYANTPNTSIQTTTNDSPAVVVSVYGINVRSAPSLNAAIIGGAYLNDVLAVTGKNAGDAWFQIQYGSGNGWVYSALVLPNEAAQTIGVVP